MGRYCHHATGGELAQLAAAAGLLLPLFSRFVCFLIVSVLTTMAVFLNLNG